MFDSADSGYRERRYQPPIDLIARLLSQVGPAQGARRADTFQQGFQPPVQDWQQPQRPRPQMPAMAGGGRPYGGGGEQFGARVDPGMIVPQAGGHPQMQPMQPDGQFDPIVAAIQRLIGLQNHAQQRF